MPAKNKTDFILLSELIHTLKDREYYRVFAKTIAMTANPAYLIPPDDELVKEMFHFFIRENELRISYNGCVVAPEFIDEEASRRVSGKDAATADVILAQELEQTCIWEKEIYVKVQDLKRLYANKCIVFPNSLLTGR